MPLRDKLVTAIRNAAAMASNDPQVTFLGNMARRGIAIRCGILSKATDAASSHANASNDILRLETPVIGLIWVNILGWRFRNI